MSTMDYEAEPRGYDGEYPGWIDLYLLPLTLLKQMNPVTTTVSAAAPLALSVATTAT